MWGSDILVAPKVKTPNAALIDMEMTEVDYYLPESELWYNYYSKNLDTATGQWNSVLLPDLEQAIFVRGGSVLPVLLHEDCMALSTCINNDIRVEIYLN